MPSPSASWATPSWNGRAQARDDPQITTRLAAAAEAGLTTVTERFRYEWTSARPLPKRSTRLTFEPAADEAFADAFEQISVGGLDVATRADTDSTNTPMVAAFERLGYRRFALRVVAS
ncbi:hypothetical protein [Paractinoplanes hotanensis]|uniref:GNAT family N-acetyltransferase n=1 Tax=Paractinoplanes hotanensis TaxID=2906497 RepID=A0ABT0XZ14_9ACTN|nr:hypothetical protein [Actinoplanes hotanensis]MCM4078845.1 hypothetical protein [Actinoplanes hotanensis]